MNKPALVGSLVVVALGAFLAGRYTRKASPEDQAKAKHILFYQDPMHPAYKSDKPGTAPDCGMKLVPVYADGDGAAAAQPGAPAGAVLISTEGQRAAGIRTEEAIDSAGER